MPADFEQPVILSGLEPEDIARLFPDEPAFRGTQIFRWIHRGTESFGEMTNLSKSLRDRLSRTCAIRTARPSRVLRGDDGTEKIRIDLADGTSVESVLLTDEKGRKTACLSTQVGCAMGCAFCRTGSMGFIRNLETSEIIEQYHLLSLRHERLSNIVFMGMGEPLLNTENLYRSVRILTHPEGPALAPRRITVSTCGIVPAIEDLARLAPGVRLAVSLPSADPVKRKELMPGASKYTLVELKKALAGYQQSARDRITVETALFRGYNTGRDDAEKLLSFTGGLNAVVNLIPFNPFEGSSFQEPSSEEIKSFTAYLEHGGLKVTRRYRRGRGILGACGQLAT